MENDRNKIRAIARIPIEEINGWKYIDAYKIYDILGFMDDDGQEITHITLLQEIIKTTAETLEPNQNCEEKAKELVQTILGKIHETWKKNASLVPHTFNLVRKTETGLDISYRLYVDGSNPQHFAQVWQDEIETPVNRVINSAAHIIKKLNETKKWQISADKLRNCAISLDDVYWPHYVERVHFDGIGERPHILIESKNE